MTRRQLCGCRSCGLVQTIPALPPRATARCTRCRQLLRRTRFEPLRLPLACALAGLALYGVVITLNFMAIRFWGLGNATNLLGFPAALGATHYWELAALFLLFILVLPPLKLLSLATVLLALRLPRPPRGIRLLFRSYALIGPWAMVEVFLIGSFVAYSRLANLASIQLGVAAWALGGLMLAMIATDAALDPEAVWQAMEQSRAAAPGDTATGNTAAGEAAAPEQAATSVARAWPSLVHDTVACLECGKVAPPAACCPRCGARLWRRKPASLSRTWACLLAAAICAVGAYAYPVMTVTRFGLGTPTTIFAGMIELATMGWWPIAIVVFIASITIPMFKLLALAGMAVTVHRGTRRGLRGRARLYRFVETIGRWSMIDIFMVSILTCLVRLGFIANIHPDLGAVAFAAVVILTMFAAYSFDPRLMWDAAARRGATPAAADGTTCAGLAAGTPGTGP